MCDNICVKCFVAGPTQRNKRAQPLSTQRITACGQFGTCYGYIIQTIIIRFPANSNQCIAHETVPIGGALVQLSAP